MVGFAVFVALIVAVVFILRSFAKQMKKVREADRAGVFDEPSDDSSDDPEQPSDSRSPHRQA